MKPISGTFRVHDREARAIHGLRMRRVSINGIADILGRSTSTVHSYIWPMGIDNRRNTPSSRRSGKRALMARVDIIRLQIRMFLAELFETIEEALGCTTVPIRALSLPTENCEADEPP